MSLSVLTKQQRAYAEARFAGVSKKAAAVAAGCPEKTASAAASRLEKHPNVTAHLSRLNGDSSPAPIASVKSVSPVAPATAPESEIPESNDEALSFFRWVMHNPSEDPKLRLDAAKALAAYTVNKPGELGKKEQKQAAAKTAGGGRFTPNRAPKLTAVK